MLHNGMLINTAHRLEGVDEQWAVQLACYAWLCGAEIGSDFIVGIHQLACKPVGKNFPEVRIAQHISTVGKDFQWTTFKRMVELWQIIQSDHFFRDLSPEDSRRRCEALDARARAMCVTDPNDPFEQAFNQLESKRAW